jgi:hypothetical protein
MAGEVAPVVWHGLTGPCAGCGVSHLAFRNTDTGVVIRLALPPGELRVLADVLGLHLQGPSRLFCQRCNVQSDRSTGSPQVDASIPPGAEKVCPCTRSSSAD